MNYYVIPATLAVTLVLMLLVSLFSRRPVRGLWVFFLVVFLATWAAQLWMTPTGPVVYGVAWVPMLLVAVFIWFLILALLPPITETTSGGTVKESSANTAVSAFVWVLMVLLVVAITYGYYRIP